MSKTALITGATSGIGAAYAKRLASQGYDLILTGRRQEIIKKLGDDLAKQFNIKVEIIIAELSDDSDIQKVVDAIKIAENLEILINNAGYGFTPMMFDENDLGKQEKMTKVLLTVPMRLIYAALPEMTKKRRGTIINVSSQGAYLPSRKMAVYAASKAFLKSFTESLYMEIKDKGIKVQVVCPGIIKTDFYRYFTTEAKASWFKAFKVVTPPELVVDCSLKDLEKHRVVCIPGAYTKRMMTLVSILPRSYVYKMAERYNY
ncbi:MAG: SDR family oxidoreductase [Dehalococcoidales bacterium]